MLKFCVHDILHDARPNRRRFRDAGADVPMAPPAPGAGTLGASGGTGAPSGGARGARGAPPDDAPSALAPPGAPAPAPPPMQTKTTPAAPQLSGPPPRQARQLSSPPARSEERKESALDRYRNQFAALQARAINDLKAELEKTPAADLLRQKQQALTKLMESADVKAALAALNPYRVLLDSKTAEQAAAAREFINEELSKSACDAASRAGGGGATEPVPPRLRGIVRHFATDTLPALELKESKGDRRTPSDGLGKKSKKAEIQEKAMVDLKEYQQALLDRSRSAYEMFPTLASVQARAPTDLPVPAQRRRPPSARSAGSLARTDHKVRTVKPKPRHREQKL